MTLDELVSQLRAAYGDALHSVLLYGSAVAGEHIQNKSDYNVLVIVESLPVDRLQAASAVARAWRDAGNPPPMTFTAAEWRASSDIFPMEYADILERHKVLYGADPCTGITVEPYDLRLFVEHEVRSKLLLLRQGVLLAGSDAKEQLSLMSASLSTLMVVFRGVVRLHGQTPPQNYADLVRDVSERTGFDPAPFYDVIHHVRGERTIAKDRTGAVLSGYVQGMETVAAHVDGLPLTRNHA
jgi:hypothetical protein